MTAKASDSGIPYAVESDTATVGDAVPPPLPPAATARKLRINPAPLKTVKMARCRKCGREWGMRGTCTCLDPDLVWPDGSKS